MCNTCNISLIIRAAMTSKLTSQLVVLVFFLFSWLVVNNCNTY